MRIAACAPVLWIALVATGAAAQDPRDRAACTGGDESACVRVADALYGAREPTEDGLAEAQRLYAHACTAGKGEACFRLGTMLRDGRTADPDLAGATAAFERGCALRNAWACNDLGNVVDAAEPPDLPRAAQLYAQACDLGSATGCANHGIMLESGRGVARDLAAATAQFERGCFGPARPTCHVYGDQLATGSLGAPEDLAHALAVYRQGCDHEDGLACERLGEAVWHGRDVRASDDAASAILSRGCRLGSAPACTAYGLVLDQGSITEEMRERSSDAFADACDGGDDPGCVAYDVVRPDVAADHAEWATRILRDACARGLALACADLAAFVESGHAAGVGARQAPQLWRDACRQEQPAACYLLYRRALAARSPEAESLRAAACHAGVEVACSPQRAPPAGHRVAPAGAQHAATPSSGGAPPAGATSNFGTVTLATGFAPDPTVVQGRSGGTRDAATLGSGCVGWIDANRPDHLFVATTPFAHLRILAGSTQDVTLVVQRPDGTYVCNDDAEQTDPIVVLDHAPAGTYRLWLGSYQQGAYADYGLGFTERDVAHPATLAPHAPAPAP